jgi:hypothetical protein
MEDDQLTSSSTASVTAGEGEAYFDEFSSHRGTEKRPETAFQTDKLLPKLPTGQTNAGNTMLYVTGLGLRLYLSCGKNCWLLKK